MNTAFYIARRYLFAKKSTQPSHGANLAFTEKIQEVIRLHGRDRLTDAEMKLTLVYRENVDWMIEKLNSGYNVIDIGPRVPSIIKSPSYAMERSFIYKK